MRSRKQATCLLLVAASTLCAAQVQDVLWRFNGDDGKAATSALIMDGAHNLYGTTRGSVDKPRCHAEHEETYCGTIYQLSPPAQDGSPWQETIIHRFAGVPDGAFPSGELATDQAGNIYGVTSFGGSPEGFGIVYQLSPPIAPGDPWTETVLHTFTGTDGNEPAGVSLDDAGNLFGTTSQGGCGNVGTVFELSPPSPPGSQWTFQSLYGFHCDNQHAKDGYIPGAPPIRGPGGNLYGTTAYGGDFTDGTVYKLMPPLPGHSAWRYKTIHSFDYQITGANPWSLLTAFQGHLYGTASEGGQTSTGLCQDLGGCGTVFRLSPPNAQDDDWTFETIYAFSGTDGASPLAGVSFDKQARLYGTTDIGGDPTCVSAFSDGCGVVFLLTPPMNPGSSWTNTTLHAFTGLTDGAFPVFEVLVGRAGAIYGTAWAGGDHHCSISARNNGCGVVFKIIP